MVCSGNSHQDDPPVDLPEKAKIRRWFYFSKFLGTVSIAIILVSAVLISRGYPTTIGYLMTVGAFLGFAGMGIYIGALKCRERERESADDASTTPADDDPSTVSVIMVDQSLPSYEQATALPSGVSLADLYPLHPMTPPEALVSSQTEEFNPEPAPPYTLDYQPEPTPGHDSSAPPTEPPPPSYGSIAGNQ